MAFEKPNSLKNSLHAAVLASCSESQLIENGLRTFKVDSSKNGAITIVNTTDGSELCFQPDATSGDQMMTVRSTTGCASNNMTVALFFRSATGQIETEDSKPRCMTVENTNDTTCPPCPWGKNGGCANQPPPRTHCETFQWRVRLRPCTNFSDSNHDRPNEDIACNATVKCPGGMSCALPHQDPAPVPPVVGRCLFWPTSQVWKHHAATMRLQSVLPGPVKELHPGVMSDWPVDVPGGFCLDAIPPSASNKVAIAAAWAQVQPSLEVKAGIATDDYATSTMTLKCGKSYRFAIGVATERDAGGEGGDYLAKARQSADVSDDALVSRLLSEHVDGWASFWGKSKIELPSVPDEYALVQEWYYCMLYLLRSSTRVGAVPPGLFGPFSTTDIPSWGDQMTLDYNFEAVSAQTTESVLLLLILLSRRVFVLLFLFLLVLVLLLLLLLVLLLLLILLHFTFLSPTPLHSPVLLTDSMLCRTSGALKQRTHRSWCSHMPTRSHG